jgi:hypothetical protein
MTRRKGMYLKVFKILIMVKNLSSRKLSKTARKKKVIGWPHLKKKNQSWYQRVSFNKRNAIEVFLDLHLAKENRLRLSENYISL